jgi:hypothetical protein
MALKKIIRLPQVGHFGIFRLLADQYLSDLSALRLPLPAPAEQT